MTIEEEIFELWKEFIPNEAYSEGLNECAGKLFVPTPENRAKITEKIGELMAKTDDRVHLKFLSSVEGFIKYREPTDDFYNIIWTVFGHIVKEGINVEHMSSLLDCTNEIVKNSMKNDNLDNLPVVTKIALMNKCNGICEIFDIVKEETDDDMLKEKIHKISSRLRDYRKLVEVEGIDKGDFSEVFPVLKSQPSLDMGRSEFYPQLISDFYDYYETPAEIEKKALLWLESEIPVLKEAAKKLAEIYGTDDDIETIDAEIAQRSSISKSELLDFIKRFRESAQKVVEDSLVKINPNYDTRIMPTPDYLLSLIPTAAMTMFDSLTEKPFNIFFFTTDEKRSPPSSFPDIFQMLIHEEYGHCVNFSNSAVGFASKPTLIENLNSKLHYPISEGISFHREFESLVLLEDLIARPEEELTENEKALLEAISEQGDIQTILLESKFVLYKWRIVRFLRAISDVRINMNKQTLVEFVEWASEKTGLKEKTIYDQLFIFQEEPGYAPCYSIAGMALREIQEDARKKGKNIREFNTLASSLGFPPRTVFEERLRDF